MQPQRRPHINLHIKTQWGNSAENYLILILQVFCLGKKGDIAKKSLFLSFHIIKQFVFCSLVATESLVKCTIHAPL